MFRRMTRGHASRTRLHYPLEEQQLRLIQIVPQPEGSTIRCHLRTESLLDVSDEFNSRSMKWTTEGKPRKLSVRELLRDPALRKDWTARSTGLVAKSTFLASKNPQFSLLNRRTASKYKPSSLSATVTLSIANCR